MAKRRLKTDQAAGEWPNVTERMRGQQERTGPLFSYVVDTGQPRSGFPRPIRCGRYGSSRIRPSIGSNPPSAGSTPRVEGPRLRRSNCCWPCCCRRSTASAPSGCSWNNWTRTGCFAGLSASTRSIPSGIPQLSPRTGTGCSTRFAWPDFWSCCWPHRRSSRC